VANLTIPAILNMLQTVFALYSVAIIYKFKLIDDVYQAKAAAVECLERQISAITAAQPGAVEAVTTVAEAILECRFERQEGKDEVAKIWLLEGKFKGQRLIYSLRFLPTFFFAKSLKCW
jgi:hypothetical protein